MISPPRATCLDASDPLAAHIKSPIDWLDRLGRRDQMRCKEVLNCCALNRADFWTKRGPSVSTVANFLLHLPRLLMPLEQWPKQVLKKSGLGASKKTHYSIIEI